MSKYHNRRCGGSDSVKERRRYNELLLLEKAGVISDLKYQVEFVLIPKQPFKTPHCIVNTKGRRVLHSGERKLTYKADFTYTENGEYIVEDAKGIATKEYIMKRKLMLFIHGIEIRET